MRLAKGTLDAVHAPARSSTSTSLCTSYSKSTRSCNLNRMGICKPHMASRLGSRKKNKNKKRAVPSNSESMQYLFMGWRSYLRASHGQQIRKSIARID